MNRDNILGTFVASSTNYLWSDAEKKAVEEQADLFRKHLWAKDGLSERLKLLKYEDYGDDIILILFEFYLKPIPELLCRIKETDYRKREQSVGIRIILTDENYFDYNDMMRKLAIKNIMLEKIDLLGSLVKKRKLDTKVEELKRDLMKILVEYSGT